MHYAQKYRYVCVKCGKTYTNKHTLYRHSRTMHGVERFYQCNICGELLACLKDLLQHLFDVHDIKKYLCYDCKSIRSSKHSIRSHVQQHLKGNKSRCEICTVCSKRFSQKELKIHAHDAADESKLICYDCNDTFLFKTLLAKHVQTHLISTKFKIECNVCFRHFTKVQLKGHEHVTSEAKVICRFCNQLFKTEEFMHAHMEVQHAMRYCEICNKVLSIVAFWKHKKAHENIKVFFRCTECNKYSASETFLRQHFLNSHPERKEISVEAVEEIKCHICGGVSKNPHALRSHLQLHKLKADKSKRCHVCDKPLKQKYYQSHMKQHERIPCKICMQLVEKRKMNEHQIFHSRRNFYVCILCGKKLWTQCGMNKHVISMHGKRKDYRQFYVMKDFEQMEVEEIGSDENGNGGEIEEIAAIDYNCEEEIVEVAELETDNENL